MSRISPEIVSKVVVMRLNCKTRERDFAPFHAAVVLQVLDGCAGVQLSNEN